jgi:hypothetical protein
MDLSFDGIEVRKTTAAEAPLWAKTAARGWSEFGNFSELMADVSEIYAHREEAFSYLASSQGKAIAAAVMVICDRIAVLAGASTVPEGRQRGAQLALLSTRLREAAARGCDLAMMCAPPGSPSQRNAERRGFRLAYTRIKWQLGLPTDLEEPS